MTPKEPKHDTSHIEKKYHTTSNQRTSAHAQTIANKKLTLTGSDVLPEATQLTFRAIHPPEQQT
jgi:hypothetical protein